MKSDTSGPTEIKPSFVKLGAVVSIVDTLVVVESERSLPPLDLDTILFKEDGQPIGPVFDVFGSVNEPHYSIKFTCVEKIVGSSIEVGTVVYFAAQSDRNVTKFAFVEELKKLKGTDASWENDNEPPDSVQEFSDDEEERQAKRDIKNKKRNIDQVS